MGFVGGPPPPPRGGVCVFPSGGRRGVPAGLGPDQGRALGEEEPAAGASGPGARTASEARACSCAGVAASPSRAAPAPTAPGRCQDPWEAAPAVVRPSAVPSRRLSCRRAAAIFTEGPLPVPECCAYAGLPTTGRSSEPCLPRGVNSIGWSEFPVSSDFFVLFLCVCFVFPSLFFPGLLISCGGLVSTVTCNSIVGNPSWRPKGLPVLLTTLSLLR